MSEKTGTIKIVQEKAPSSGIYFVTAVGAAFYFLHHATSLLAVIWALIKAVVWPGIVVYHVLVVLHA